MKKRALILAMIAFIAATTDRGKCRSDIRTAYKDTYTEGYGCESLYGSK